MISLSPLIAGTMTWGTWGKNLDLDGMKGLIRTCIENGIDTFDHADIYGGYTTEAAFGKAFSSSGISRESVKFISKCGIQYPSENRPVPIKHYDYSQKHILFSVDNSLRNLQTDYLDLLLLHRPSPMMQPDEVAEAITRLKDEGKIRDFGVSNFTPSQTDLIRTRLEVSYNQIEFSATHWQPMTDGSLDYMMSNGIRPMAWSPLGSVFKVENPQTDRLRNLLIELIAKYNLPGDIILLAWILKHPASIIPVCGTASPERISELTKAATANLSDEDWFRIWVESRGEKVP